MKKGQGSIEQRIRDRFHGINDPVAKKILDKIKETSLPEPPDDMNITTLFIGGVNDDSIDEEAIVKSMEGFGKVKGVKIVNRQGYAFVSFHARDAAEQAMKCLHNRYFINNKRLKVLWAKAQLENTAGVVPGEKVGKGPKKRDRGHRGKDKKAQVAA